MLRGCDTPHAGLREVDGPNSWKPFISVPDARVFATSAFRWLRAVVCALQRLSMVRIRAFQGMWDCLRIMPTPTSVPMRGVRSCQRLAAMGFSHVPVERDQNHVFLTSEVYFGVSLRKETRLFERRTALGGLRPDTCRCAHVCGSRLCVADADPASARTLLHTAATPNTCPVLPEQTAHGALPPQPEASVATAEMCSLWHK